MEDEKEPLKDNNKQHHQPETGDRVHSSEKTPCAEDSHGVEDKCDQEVQTDLAIDSNAKIAIIIEKNEELSCTNPETSGMTQVISVEVSNVLGAGQQNDTLSSHISLSESDSDTNDFTSIKKLEEVKGHFLSIVKNIEETIKISNQNLQTSDTPTTEIPHGINTSRDQPADIISTPSTSYNIPSEEKLGSYQEERPSTSYLAFTPDTNPSEPPSADFCPFIPVEDEKFTPVNKNRECEVRKLLMDCSGSQKDESPIVKHDFPFRSKGGKIFENPTPLKISVWPKPKGLNNLTKPDETINTEKLEADNSENIPVRSDSVWTIDDTPNKDEDNTLTSQSVEFEEQYVDQEQDADRTESSAYQTAIFDLDNTNLSESFNSDYSNVSQGSACSLKRTQEIEHLPITKDTTSLNENPLKSKSEQHALELDILDSISHLYEEEGEKILEKEPDLHSEVKDKTNSPESQEHKSDENKTEVLLPKTSTGEEKPGEYKSEVVLPKLSTSEDKPAANKPEVLVPKTSTYELKPDEYKAESMLSKPSTHGDKQVVNEAEVLLPKTSAFENKPGENKVEFLMSESEKKNPNDSLDQKLLMQFPSDWSTLSDFNLDSAENRNIVHSTPLRDTTIEEVFQEKLSSLQSLQPEDTVSDKYKSPLIAQQERIAASIKVLPDENGSQVDWFWLPANKLDFLLPSACCYEMLSGEDTHSDSSSRVDESEKGTEESDTTLKASNNSSKEDLHLESGDAPTEQKTIVRPEKVLNVTFDRANPALNETFVREGPELHKRVDKAKTELNKTFDKSSPDLIKPSDQKEPEIGPESSAHALNVTLAKPKPVELKSAPVKEYKNKGWDRNEESNSFFSLNPIIHGFYDLYDIPKFSPLLSTIYEVSESDSNASILQVRDDAQLEKIRRYVGTFIEERKREHLYYDMGSVMTRISENPYTAIDELFVLGKYNLIFEGSEGSDSTLKPDGDDVALAIPIKTEKEDKNVPKKYLQPIEEIQGDTDLEMFCKQELDKFPKDILGIRFKQVIKFNGKILFDCRCNYSELPLKLRRKYEGQENVLLEFNHLIIPNQRKIYFSLHCCRHTIAEMLQIKCISDNNKYLHQNYIEAIVYSYRCAYVKSQLTHTPEPLPSSAVQPKFFANVIDDKSKNKFVQDWLNTSRPVEQKLEQPSTSSSRVSRHYSEFLESQREPFINLLDLEESASTLSLQLTRQQTYFKEQKKEDEDES